MLPSALLNKPCKTTEELIIIKTMMLLLSNAIENYGALLHKQLAGAKSQIENMTFTQRELVGKRNFQIICDTDVHLLPFALDVAWRDDVKRIIIETVMYEVKHGLLAAHMPFDERLRWRSGACLFIDRIQDDEFWQGYLNQIVDSINLERENG